MTTSRRSFVALTLLGSAAFSLHPRRALAALEDTGLLPRFSARLSGADITVSVGLHNRDAAPLSAMFSPRSAISLAILSGETEHALPLAESEPGLLTPSEQELRSRAGPRQRQVSLPPGDVLVARLGGRWPEDVPRTAETRLVVRLSGRLADGSPFTLTETIPITVVQG